MSVDTMQGVETDDLNIAVRDMYVSMKNRDLLEDKHTAWAKRTYVINGEPFDLILQRKEEV